MKQIHHTQMKCIMGSRESATWNYSPPLEAFLCTEVQDDGVVDNCKSRLVVKGFQEGHFAHVHSLVVDFYAVRTVLAYPHPGAINHHMDVESAFLNGVLAREEIVYVYPPGGLDLGLKKWRQ